MRHAARAELAYIRPWLLGGLGISLGVVALVTAIFAAFGGPPPFAAAAIRAMFPMLAFMVVAFIVQAFRNEERRARLLLAGPLTPRGLAAVSVLVPVALAVFGFASAGLVVGIDSAITGVFTFETVHIVGYVGGQLLLFAQAGLLIQEAVMASRQRRRRAAVLGWATLLLEAVLVAVVTIAASVYQGPWTWPLLHAANLVAALGAMIATIALYTGRTDFTV